jgi:hypothetical protein
MKKERNKKKEKQEGADANKDIKSERRGWVVVSSLRVELKCGCGFTGGSEQTRRR